MDRSVFRKKLLSKRREFGQEGLARISAAAVQRLVASRLFRQSDIIHAYYGVVKKGELPTAGLLQSILDSGKTLVMPKMADTGETMEDVSGSPAGDKMFHYVVESLDELVPNKIGIPEPVEPRKIDVLTISLVIVPGLASDVAGNRIGYGKGYYDRFLRHTPAVRVMLLPEACVHAEIPPEAHDVPVHYLVTEKQWVDCSGNK